MPMNPALEGKIYPPVRFEVREEHVRRFAHAVGDDGSFVPPTFVTAPEVESGLGHAIPDTDLGMDFARVVHGEQEFEWSRPVRVGDVLEAVTTIESIRSKGGHGFLTLRTEIRDEGGALVAIARSSLVERGEA